MKKILAIMLLSLSCTGFSLGLLMLEVPKNKELFIVNAEHIKSCRYYKSYKTHRLVCYLSLNTDKVDGIYSFVLGGISKSKALDIIEKIFNPERKKMLKLEGIEIRSSAW